MQSVHNSILVFHSHGSPKTKLRVRKIKVRGERLAKLRVKNARTRGDTSVSIMQRLPPVSRTSSSYGEGTTETDDNDEKLGAEDYPDNLIGSNVQGHSVDRPTGRVRLLESTGSLLFSFFSRGNYTSNASRQYTHGRAALW